MARKKYATLPGRKSTRKLLRSKKMKYSLDELVDTLHPVRESIGDKAFSSVAGLVKKVNNQYRREWWKEARARRDVIFNAPARIKKTADKVDVRAVAKIYEIAQNKSYFDYGLSNLNGYVKSCHSLADKLSQDHDADFINNVLDLHLDTSKRSWYASAELLAKAPKLLEMGGYEYLERVKKAVDPTVKGYRYYRITEPLFKESVKIVRRLGIDGFERLTKSMMKVADILAEERYSKILYRTTFDLRKEIVPHAASIVKAEGEDTLERIARRGTLLLGKVGPHATYAWLSRIPRTMRSGGYKRLDILAGNMEKIAKRYGNQVTASLIRVMNKLERIGFKHQLDKEEGYEAIDGLLERIGVVTDRGREINKTGHKEAAEFLQETPEHLSKMMTHCSRKQAMDLYDLAIDSMSPVDRKAPSEMLSFFASNIGLAGYHSVKLAAEAMLRQRSEGMGGIKSDTYHESIMSLRKMGGLSFIKEVFLQTKSMGGTAINYFLASSYDLLKVMGFSEKKRRPRKETASMIDLLKRSARLYDICGSNKLSGYIVKKKVDLCAKSCDAAALPDRISSLEGYIEEYAGIVDKYREMNFDPDFFEKDIQRTLLFYESYLGKTIDRFGKDFLATGKEISLIVEIYENYLELVDEGVIEESRLKSLLNYIGKQRSRDLLKSIHFRWENITEVEIALRRLDPTTGKRDTVKVIDTLNRTYRHLKNVGRDAISFLRDKIEALPEGANSEEMIKAIKSSTRGYVEEVIGRDVEIPPELSDRMDNIVSAYYREKRSDNGSRPAKMKDSLRMIASTYLHDGPDAAVKRIQELPGNVRAREWAEKAGFDLDAYTKGVEMDCIVSSDKNEFNRVKERITSELDHIYTRLRSMEIDEKTMEGLTTQDIPDQLRTVESIIEKFEFDENDLHLKDEIETHINSVRGVKGLAKKRSAEVRFYVCQDPIDGLHMGSFFKTCIGLRSFNAWASVAQVMDVNKNVIYARAKDGRYFARNRTALTDKGVLCTAFYHNTDLPLDKPWIDYLSEFANAVNADVMVPSRFMTHLMRSAFDTLVDNGSALVEERNLTIAPAYFSEFYGDGLLVKKHADGSNRVTTKVYVIPAPEKRITVAEPAADVLVFKKDINYRETSADHSVSV